MSIGIGIAGYLLLWWVLLFAVLPLGVKSQREMNDVIPGSEPGAPVRPQLWRKALTTSIVAAFAWAVIYMMFRLGLARLWT